MPEWFLAMRACRYLGTDFCRAHGISYSGYVQQWANVAEAAEIEAQHLAMERARS